MVLGLATMALVLTLSRAGTAAVALALVIVLVLAPSTNRGASSDGSSAARPLGSASSCCTAAPVCSRASRAWPRSNVPAASAHARSCAARRLDALAALRIRGSASARGTSNSRSLASVQLACGPTPTASTCKRSLSRRRHHLLAATLATVIASIATFARGPSGNRSCSARSRRASGLPRAGFLRLADLLSEGRRDVVDPARHRRRHPGRRRPAGGGEPRAGARVIARPHALGPGTSR